MNGFPRSQRVDSRAESVLVFSKALPTHTQTQTLMPCSVVSLSVDLSASWFQFLSVESRPVL